MLRIAGLKKVKSSLCPGEHFPTRVEVAVAAAGVGLKRPWGGVIAVQRGKFPTHLRLNAFYLVVRMFTSPTSCSGTQNPLAR